MCTLVFILHVLSTKSQKGHLNFCKRAPKAVQLMCVFYMFAQAHCSVCVCLRVSVLNMQACISVWALILMLKFVGKKMKKKKFCCSWPVLSLITCK